MTSIKSIRAKNPTVLTILKKRGGTRRRVMASMATKTIRPPSRAGIGKRLMIARFMEIRAAKVKR